MIKPKLDTNKFSPGSPAESCSRDHVQHEQITSDESDDASLRCNGLREVDSEDKDELLFVIPDRVQLFEWDSASKVTSSEATKTVVTDTRSAVRTKITTLDRLMWTQNIWCLPNLSRKEAEDLLRGAEPGNFILRVNRTNCAMVLSRRILDSASHDGLRSVQHNTIEVVPRSGYCLTSDKSTQLIFGSLVQLLHFYLRISRERNIIGGAFLQLPRAIAQASTLEALEQLNQLGKGFWCIDTDKSEERKTQRTTQNTMHVSRRSSRTSSADRWSGTLDTSAASTSFNMTRLRSRAREPQTTAESHTIFRGRASSLGESGVDRAHRKSPEGLANGNSYSKLTNPSLSGASSAPKPHVEATPQCADPLTTQRTRTRQNGVYEDQESEFWRSLTTTPNIKPEFVTQQKYERITRGCNKSAFSEPRSKHLNLPHYDREEEEERCKLWPTPPPYSPSGLTVAALWNSDSQPTTTNTCDVKRGGGDKETTKRPILTTLDEHLRSLERQEEKEFVTQDRKQLQLHGKNNVIHQVPYWRKTVSDKRFGEQQEQINGGSRVRQESSSSSTTGATKHTANDGAVAVNDTKNAMNHNGCKTPEHSTIQLPSPKTVGKVFVMEAATHSSDDYELLSESVSGRQLYTAPAPDLSQKFGARDWPVERGTGKSGCLDERTLTGSCKLRRAHTTRDSSHNLFPERVVIRRDSVEAKRRYAMFLDNMNGWRKSSEEAHQCAQSSADEFVTIPKPPTKSWQTDCLLPASSKELAPVDTSSASQPTDSLSAGTRNYEQMRVSPEAQQTLWRNGRGNCGDDGLHDIANQTKPHPGSAPLATFDHQFTTTNCTVATEPPIPRSRRTLTSTSTRSTQSEKQDSNADPSPSTSSRASTVFCTPWDSAPTGVYLSDLIQLAGGGIAGTNRREMPPHFRRRTLSSLDPRLLNERPASAGEPSQHNRKTEFQRLLWLWMQHSTTTNDKSIAATQPHIQSGSDEPTTNGPPPVPQRRLRLKHLRDNLPTISVSRSVRSDESTDINPYAVVPCSTDRVSSDCTSSEVQVTTATHLSQDVMSLKAHEGESFGVYDDTFVENTDDHIGEVTLSKLGTEPSSKNAALSNSSKISAGHGEIATPRNYVYAQVLPRNLRQQSHPSSPPCSTKLVTNAANEALTSARTALVTYSNTIAKGCPIFSPSSSSCSRAHSDSSSNELFIPSDYSPLPAVIRSRNKRIASHQRSRPLSISLSLSSLSSKSPSPSPTLTYATQWPPLSAVSSRDSKHNCATVNDNHTITPGHYIRRFVNRLMRDKSSPVSKQINLFLDCTRNSINQGPYRTMQSVRQFISGITNHLLQNPKLGLPSAIELEKRQLSDYGFVNVGALLESSLQKYVLRPLHRHIIRKLRQEQIKNTEFGPLRSTVHLINNISPSEFGIPSHIRIPTEPVLQRVRELFRQVQSTYSVSRKIVHLVELFNLIRNEVGAYSEHTQLNPEDLQLVFVWTFAHAGLLLASATDASDDPLRESQPTSSKIVFCPAALQADYLDGLLTKSQLQNQAVGQCCLNDLFATLYVTWTWSNTRYNSSSELLTGPLSPTTAANSGSRDTHQGDSNRISRKPNSHIPNSNHMDIVVGSEKVNGSCIPSKRRILPPRRRKTITAIAAQKELQPQSPLSGTKWYAQSSSRSVTISELTKKDNSEQHDLLQNLDSFTRWRPWVPNHSSPTCSTGLEQPMIRVLAVDEHVGQIRTHMYPARPSLTAAELCNLLSFEMKIFDPKEYGLFAHIDGKEILLPDHIHLVDFVETSSSGSKQTLVSTPSPTMFTTKPTLQTARSMNKPVQRSLSSRSNSPPSTSSLESYPRGIKKPERSNSFSVTRWLMRKRNGMDAGGAVVPTSEMKLVGTQLEPTTSTDALGLFPSALHHTMGGVPVLIYKRITGVFAISERAFRSHRDTPHS